MNQGDWLCPKCNFLNFARNVKCLHCDSIPRKTGTTKGGSGSSSLEKGGLDMRKCKEKPPKRELNPGEWECKSCNYINFRRNMVCLKCDHKRPRSSDEPVHGGGYHNSSRVSFVGGDANVVNNGSYSGQCRGVQNRGANSWRFVVEENDNRSHSNSLDKASRFVDFPIAGGETELSQNPQERDRWKLKMLEKSKGAATDGK